MKRVLITAGANGIGLVMAQAFSGAGYRVWVTDVDGARMISGQALAVDGFTINADP
jgi:NAD(P)-dependent dehydrogenase (short-subunit alcohol dehydrogenase family)